MTNAQVTQELEAMGMDNPVHFKDSGSTERCYLGKVIESSGSFAIVTTTLADGAKTRMAGWTSIDVI